MRTLIIMAVGVLAVGCGKILTEEEQKLRDSVVGEYELMNDGGNTVKYVFLENGIAENYTNGKKVNVYEWSIVNRLIHCDNEVGDIGVSRINKDRSITWIASIVDGTRHDNQKEKQQTFKKIK